MTRAFDKISLRASIAKDSLYDFVREFWSEIIPETPVWNWHVEFLCKELELVAKRVFLGLPKLHDIACNISPGTTKSTLASIMFPAWCWANMPSCRVITASYAFSLAMDLSRKSRDLIKSDKYRLYYPEVEVREDQDTKGYFINSKGGMRFSVGVNGSVMGMHAHVLVVDDPIDPNQALSEAEVRSTNHWMENTLPSRKVDKSVTPTVLIHQRLRENDPTGLWLEKAKAGKAKIRHICIPAELPPKDKSNVSPPELRKKYVRGLMDPVRLSKEVLDEYRANGEYMYSAQFLQSPVPIGGGLFQEEYFNQRRKSAPYNCTRIRYWDKASTQGGGDYTAGILLARDSEGFYVEHVEHGQWEPGNRNEHILATARKDRLRYGKYEPRIYIEREGGSSGRDAWKSVARKLAGFPVFEDAVTGNKEVRAHPWSAQLQAMNVRVIEDGTWDVNGYIAEHCSFPFGKHDDRVDASSGAFNLLVNRNRPLGIRVLPLRDIKKKSRVSVIVIGSRDPLALSPRDCAVLIRFRDPLDETEWLEPEGIKESLTIVFADIEPEQYQDKWDKKIREYKKKPEEVMMTRDQGKALWSFVTKKRSENPRVVVMQGDTRSPLSAANGLCGALGLVKTDAILLGVNPYNEENTPDENGHVVGLVKMSRNYVI